jgi:hypothetical protein
MPPGLAFTDELILSPTDDHDAVVVLARWQDTPNRSDGHRRIAQDLRPMADEDVRLAMRRVLLDYGWAKVAQGGRDANSRRIIWIDPRFERRGAEQWVWIPPELLHVAATAGRNYTAVRLRYLALLCREQIIAGQALISDSEAAKLIGCTYGQARGARLALEKVGVLVQVGAYKERPIYEVPDAYVPPDGERFAAERAASRDRTKPMHSDAPDEYFVPARDRFIDPPATPRAKLDITPTPDDLEAFLQELDERDGLVAERGTPSLLRKAPLVAEVGTPSLLREAVHDSYDCTTSTTYPPSAGEEGYEQEEARPAETFVQDEAAPVKGAGDARMEGNADPGTPSTSSLAIFTEGDEVELDELRRQWHAGAISDDDWNRRSKELIAF